MEIETEAIVPHYDLVPEVVSCQFEYFDGAAWVSEWPTDGNSEVSYPAAIRVRFDLINARELEKMTELETPDQESKELEQELNDSFSAETDDIETNPGLNADETEESAPESLSPLGGITPRSYWRIFLLENPKPSLDAFGLGSGNKTATNSLGSFQQ